VPRSTVRIREQAIQTQIIQYFHLRGVFCWKNNTTGIYVKARNVYIPNPAKGLSEDLGVLPRGRFLAIEVKRPGGGKPSEQQTAFVQEINSRGGLAFFACSVEDVMKVLGPE
jgi:hypothetical protein